MINRLCRKDFNYKELLENQNKDFLMRSAGSGCYYFFLIIISMEKQRRRSELEGGFLCPQQEISNVCVCACVCVCVYVCGCAHVCKREDGK